MLNLKSLVFAILFLSIAKAVPLVDAALDFQTVTLFNFATIEIPDGIDWAQETSFDEKTTTLTTTVTSTMTLTSDFNSKSNETPLTSIDSRSSAVSETSNEVLESYSSDSYFVTSTSEPTITTTFAEASTSTSTSATSTSTSTSPTSTSLFDSNVIHNGDATYYSVGADNCGTSSSDTDYVCAISQQLYNTVTDSESISEYCGHMINITYNDKNVQVKVVDSCPSCDKDSLDLSPSAFEALADLEIGVLAIEWQWIS